MANEIQRQSATEWFHERIAELKKQLPENHKMLLIAELPKSYDSYGGGLIITNVLNGRSTDMNVLNAIESVIRKEKLKKEETNLSKP